LHQRQQEVRGLGGADRVRRQRRGAVHQPGLENRIAQGIVDFESGEGFHGLIAFDVDGDGVADFSTWIGVGPDGHEIPIEAQFRGPACRGITNLGIYFEQCVGA
jgi:hypothetical protein